MSTRSRSSGILRAALVAVLAFVLATVYSSNALAAAPNSGTTTTAKVAEAVADQLAQSGSATFFAVLDSEANLDSVARTGEAGGKRTADVFNAKVAHADRTQAGLRDLLTARGARFTPFWIANTIEVTGDAALVAEIAARPEVRQILPNRTHPLEQPTAAPEEGQVDAVEWNISQIRANKVWSDFNDRGEGIVVASVDTGVAYQHPALGGKYRGNKGDGTFDHNYNWFDPAKVCGNPSLAPCDNNNHGSHTMGTMVGDDGAANQVGVAPGAKWISAKGCESNNCSDASLLASGQWIVAPTDLNNQNPRPDLAPDVVNNSWGGDPNDPWYADIVNTWIAAGIFPQFSNGNSGALGCNSSGSPGDYAASYSAGAYDINGAIASFSSRGPGAGGLVKPNISAPGVAIRSSIPSGYGSISGTSMASPHVAGTVALLWSAAPALKGNINATKALLNQTAVDTSNLTCGGTAENNNVWGEGKLDAYALVAAAPKGPTGTVSGTVTSGGKPAADVRITVTGPQSLVRTTGADGTYRFDALPVGDYVVTASKFGLATKETKVTVVESKPLQIDFDLPPAASFAVTGTVKAADGSAVADTTVAVVGTPIPAVRTNASGAYTIPGVPAGTYDISADYGRWLQAAKKSVVVNGPTTADFVLQPKVDGYGYTPRQVAPSWVDNTTALPLTGDNASANVTLPFPVTFYGKTYKTAAVHTDGYLAFAGTGLPGGAIPSPTAPNGAVYAFWDDLVVDASASVRTLSDGAAPNRRFVVEWRNVTLKSAAGSRLSIQLILTEGGRVQIQYRGVDSTAEAGATATVGLENETGTVALPYSVKQPVLSDSVAITVWVPNTGLIRGTITDANDKQAIAGGTVAVQRAGSTVTATTDAAGFYQAQVPLGSFTAVATRASYESARANLTIGSEGFVLTQDFALKTPGITADPGTLEIVVPQGEKRTRTVTVRNTGTATGTWDVKEVPGGVLGDPDPQAKKKVVRAKGFDPNARTSQGDGVTATGAAPQAAGQVLKQWPINDLNTGWGAGFNAGNVYTTDAVGLAIGKYSTDGAFGGQFPASFGGWPADLTFIPSRGLLCVVTVGGDNAIRCLNPATGQVVNTITGPWSSVTSQRGLAYRADDDTFYVGGWNQRVVYHVKGLSYPDAGAVVGQCAPAAPADGIAGLAYSPRGALWIAPNAATEPITAVNPDTCAVITSVPDPNPAAFTGAGLEIDDTGNLWAISQTTGQKSTAYLVESPIPSAADVPWLGESATSGTLAAGASQQVTVSVDATNLQPGVYGATILLSSNSAKKSTIGIPVKVVVPKTRISLDAGGTGGVDALGDTWQSDQAYNTGGYGWLGQSSHPVSTTETISGTPDQTLYRTQREGAYEYRFDGLAPGTYQVELDYAELGWTDPNSRLFDVIIEGKLVTPALDVAGEVGGFAALSQSSYVRVDDGQLNVRFVSRSGQPIVNGVRITERPDR